MLRSIMHMLVLVLLAVAVRFVSSFTNAPANIISHRSLYMIGKSAVTAAVTVTKDAKETKEKKKTDVKSKARRGGGGGAGGGGGGRAGSSSSSSSRRRSGGNSDNTWKPLSLFWRVYNVEVQLGNDEGKDSYIVNDHIVNATCRSLGIKMSELNSNGDDLKVSIVRKSFDGRWKKMGKPTFVYTVDVELSHDVCKKIRPRHVDGQMEMIIKGGNGDSNTDSNTDTSSTSDNSKHKVTIVGAGPAGLFCALELLKYGIKPVIIERGQPVETRGRDIGALFNRKILDTNSNLCHGEGGAGTWSDGKCIAISCID